jgi:hypothetical protein
MGLFSLGLAWTYYVFAQRFDLGLRQRLWSAYCIGILILAAVMTVSFALKGQIPFWPKVEQFGFFPNRNQTSNVLAMGGIMIYAIGLRQLQKQRRSWWLWIYSLALIFWALVINYSRSGIALFFGGAIVWHAFWIHSSSDRRRPAIALAALLALALILATIGGATLARFNPKTPDGLGSNEPSRLAIQHDAWQISTQAPVLGIGLGNFGAIFSAKKKFYDAQKAAIHPESDIFWTAVEMGWPAVILLVVFLGWWIRQCLPLLSGTEQRLRAAAMTAVGAFIVHGFFDVSGHRIGALWPALFLATTSMRPNVHFRSSIWVSHVFRIIGMALLALGVWWFASFLELKTLPTSLQRQRVQSRIDEALTNGNFSQALQPASKLLTIAPLDWNGYQARGVAEAASHDKAAAQRDFAIAQYLLPFWPELWWREGVAWMIAGEIDDSFATWGEMFHRFPNAAPGFYRQMYELIKGDTDLTDRWRVLGRENKQCLLVFFRVAGPVEFRVELNRLLAADPELQLFDSTEKSTLFRAWYERGDKLGLAQALREHLEWERIGWRELARTYGDYADYRSACDIVHKYAQLPQIPDVGSDESLADIEAKARLHPSDASAAAYLCVALAKSGQTDQSLARIQAIRSMPGCPAYVAWLEGQLWEGRDNWKNAWTALAPFANW